MDSGIKFILLIVIILALYFFRDNYNKITEGLNSELAGYNEDYQFHAPSSGEADYFPGYFGWSAQFIGNRDLSISPYVTHGGANVKFIVNNALGIKVKWKSSSSYSNFYYAPSNTSGWSAIGNQTSWQERHLANGWWFGWGSGRGVKHEVYIIPYKKKILALPGPKGEQGPIGPRGVAGQTGTGLQGTKGNQGPTGGQGPIGPQGAKGLQGVPGSTGTLGTVGPRGPIGEKGLTGAIGPSGKTITGPKGEQGIVGPKGAAGTGLQMKQFAYGQMYNEGDYVFQKSRESDDKSMWIAKKTFTSTSMPHLDEGDNWMEFEAPKGEAGARGQPGRRGPMGDVGDTGRRGESIVGPQGDTGLTGSTGPMGPQGHQGSRGYTGDKGVRGDTGLMGDRGKRGYRGESGKIKQYKEVMEGVPDLSITHLDCMDYAKTLNADYEHINNPALTAGCFNFDPGTGIREYRFNDANTAKKCGLRYKSGLIRCLHEEPYDMVKTYNKEFDIISAGPADLSVSKKDCKRYSDMNALDMEIIDDKNAPPGCFRWRRNRNMRHLKNINGNTIPKGCPISTNCPGSKNIDYKDNMMYNETMGGGVNCGLNSKSCIQLNPNYKDNDNNLHDAALNVKLGEQQNKIDKYKRWMKDMYSKINRMEGDTNKFKNNINKGNNDNSLREQSQLIYDVAAAEKQMGRYKPKVTGFWKVEGLKNESIYNRPSMFNWFTDLLYGKKEGMDTTENNKQLNKQFIQELTKLVLKKVKAGESPSLMMNIKHDELIDISTRVQQNLEPDVINSITMNKKEIPLANMLAAMRPLPGKNESRAHPDSINWAILTVKPIVERSIISHFKEKNTINKRDLNNIIYNIVPDTNWSNNFSTKIYNDTGPTGMGGQPRDKEWLEKRTFQLGPTFRVKLDLEDVKPTSNDLGKGAGSKIADMDTPLTGESSGPAKSPQAADEMSKNKCIKGCSKPDRIHSDCSKDIIRQVIDGQDKYYRSCTKICLPREHKNYINYDKSGPDLPYNPIDHGCRNTQAHCVKNCSKTLVEVDENGRDLKELNRHSVPLYSKSKTFSVSQTNNMFGQTGNRLGGSKTGYRKNYKPENPNPKAGFGPSDAMWSFKP